MTARRRRAARRSRWVGRLLGPPAAVLLAVCLAGQGGRWWAVLDLLNSLALWLGAAGIVLAVAALITGRRFALVCALMATGLSAERVVPEWLRPIPQAAEHRAADLTVLTYNVYLLQPDPDRVARQIVAAGADIVLLQEASGILSNPVSAARLLAQYPFQTGCQWENCDRAVLSRVPFAATSHRFGGPRNGSGGTPVARVVVAAEGSRPAIEAASLHLPRGWGGPVEVAGRAQLADTLQRFGTPALLVGGDFNLSPYMFAMQVLDDAAMPLVRVTRATPTFPGNWRVLGMPVPAAIAIDHLFVGPQWAVRSVERLPSAGSDHHPLLITLAPRVPAAP